MSAYGQIPLMRSYYSQLADSIADSLADSIADSLADSIADSLAGSIADTRADKSRSLSPVRPTNAPDRSVMCLVYPDGSVTTVVPASQPA